MNLVSGAMAALTFGVAAIACSAGSSNPSRDTGANPDAGESTLAKVRRLEGNPTACGCTVTTVPLDPLPDQLTDFGSPTQVASAISGTWTNRDGDKLAIAPAASGTI